MKIIASNKKAGFDYFISEKVEAGISLLGTEVKSIRDGKINLKDSYAVIKNNEAFLLNTHISEYSHGNINNHDPLRTRKLLLHRSELNKLLGKITQKGFTLIPTLIYWKENHIKVEIGLAKRKKKYDKREDLKKKDVERELRRVER